MRTTSTAGTALLLSAALLLVGCSDNGSPTGPPAAAPRSSAPSAPPSPSTSPSPSPSPSPKPLSAFEGDPAVVAFRANLRAGAEAINSRNLKLPALLATSTARRAVRYPVIYAEDLKLFFPGTRPVAVLGVRTASPTAKNILTCSLESGFGLDKEGGTPVGERLVIGGAFAMVLEGGAWKVDQATADPSVSCDGVALPGAAA